ncbi:hypothetical protein [uncultured Roseobacter sp.]|uniref:hypothetical protein n=1 Tax=uncultured Roseobacter sp. TaxID=114847 RepID=UPI002628DF7F|nr:hypothetical protein [uncultured Roseobacter sp.]
MTRYNWPREFSKSPDMLAQRQEQAARDRGIGLPGGVLGDLEELDDVIQANFDEARTWIPLGPSIMTNGQAEGNPVVAGRVRAIKVSPNGQRIYVGSANGGVWYSADAGVSWVPLGAAGLAPTADRSDLSLTIGALWVVFGKTGAADDPAKDIVYVGTGESNPRLAEIPGRKLGGLGVLRLSGTLPDALANPLQNPWTREAKNLAGRGIFRLAADPGVTPTLAGAGTLVAAASNGLWSREGDFDEDSDWNRVEFTTTNFADLPGDPYCSDVVWNDKGLWVTLAGSGAQDGLYRSPTGLGGTFERIALTNMQPKSRISIAPAPDTDRMYVLGKVPSPFQPATNLDHAALWQVDLSQSTNSAPVVQNVPVGLFVSRVRRDGAGNLITTGNDQADYDQAIAVRKVGSDDVVTIGGSLELYVDWNAALFDLTITGSGAGLTTDFDPGNQHLAVIDSTYIGLGMHPDVHVLTEVGGTIWVGCDGGVFRHSGGTTRAMNAGLAIAEPGYIASHPALDGPMIAGTQDNGAIQRIGDTVWSLQRKGDGGGCLFHPTQPHQRVMQYVQASWNFEPAAMTPWGPVVRTDPATTAETDEGKRSSFYSQGAAAAATDNADARLFLGTNRIWYSDKWRDAATNMNWVTIPSLTDGHAAAALNQDWLTEGGVRDPVLGIEILQEGDTADQYEGTALLVLCTRTIRIFRSARAVTPGPQVWTPIANSVVSTSSGVERPKSKKDDDVPNPFLDYLPHPATSAWTDIAVHDATVSGRETFYVTTTGQRSEDASGDIVSDPEFDTLWWYNGQGRWYPTGLRNAPLDAGSGTGGSPAGAHCVIVDPEARDHVYVGNRIGVWHGEIDRSGEHPSWTWRPAMEGLPQTMVQDLSISVSTAGTFLRAALVSRGVWEREISDVPTSVGKTFIRTVPHDTGRMELPATALSPLDNVTDQTFHKSPDLIILPTGAHPWDPGLPNEADLLTAPEAVQYAQAVHDVFAMVHHRHTTPVPGSDVNIDLFLQSGAPSGDLSGFAMTNPWRTFVQETVQGNSPAAVAGLTYVGRGKPTAPVDARTPRAVKFTVDLTHAGPSDYAMLIAVVTSPGNPLSLADLNRAHLKAVVRRSAQVAVRKFKRA